MVHSIYYYLAKYIDHPYSYMDCFMYEEQKVHSQLLQDAFNQYLIHFYESSLTPTENLLDYDFDFLVNNMKRFDFSMVENHLQELTNLINRWHASLWRWNALELVLNNYEEMDAWEIRSEFLDYIAYECLLMPASIRDVFTSVATASFHQIRLKSEIKYKDRLEGEPNTSEGKFKYLNRVQKESRLQKMVSVWENSSDFLMRLREVNSADYVNKTSNYRNLSAHSISPCFEFGHTHLWSRSLVQKQILKENDDGSYDFVDVPGELDVSYGFGGIAPLNLKSVLAANLVEFDKARRCYTEYRKLLESAVKGIESLKF